MSKTIVNYSEVEEREYLEEIKAKLYKAINDSDQEIDSHSQDIKEYKEYLWENKTGMDHAEKVSVRQSIQQTALTGENTVAKKNRLQKLLKSPYFGRIDFVQNVDSQRIPLYIGIHSFFDPTLNANLIHDWRAPVASMFYDYELGEASFEAPNGETKGEILLKRQYRIRQGEMEFMLESSLNIHDDILQQELSQTSDEKMKNIVATIQRDQNAIIRNDKSRVLIIQGVAGSGKTSIALHRIAFLLYKFKQTISSKDILIISPNSVFADYISNVLPELGEEQVRETGMEELASELLEDKYKFQTFSEQVAQLLEKQDKKLIERIEHKSSVYFINKLDEYLLYIEKEYFQPTEIMVRRFIVPAWFVKERFEAYHRLPLMKRFPEIVKDVVDNISIYYKYDVNSTERNEIRKAVNNMFVTKNLRKLYKDFYQWLGRPDLFKLAKGSVLEYADVFPMIYFKMQLEGLKPYRNVKHLLVDEMQDYTPIQYRVINKLFPCNKTILGDSNQSVNPHSSSSAEEIQKVFSSADSMILRKSYRSTYEIIQFAQKIHRNPELIAIKRHGEHPVIKGLQNEEEEVQAVHDLIMKYTKSSNNSLGIVCKTYTQAKYLYDQIQDSPEQINLLTSESVSFVNGIIITNAHMAKGLEFDHVIVPFCSSNNYKTNIDKYMLYIACTRAMHKLHLTHAGEITKLINN